MPSYVKEFFLNLSTAFKALDKVIPSEYSISLPWEFRRRSLLLYAQGFNQINEIKGSGSPSTVGLLARITSEIFSFRSLSSSSFIFRWSGPTPSKGEIAPCNTWYLPLKPPVFSMAIRSFGPRPHKGSRRPGVHLDKFDTDLHPSG